MELVDILELLKDGKTIQICPRGYSMYPMFVPERDAAILRQAEQRQLKRGDVVLYRREGSILVLHRIWRVDGDKVYLIGDNQECIEGPLRMEQVKGILIAFVRNGRTVSVKHPVYRLWSWSWLLLLPWRGPIKRMAARIRKATLR